MHNDEIEKAWKNHISAQNHDITICFLDKSAEEYDEKAENIAKGLIKDLGREIIKNIKIKDCDSAIVIFNPYSFNLNKEIIFNLEFEKPISGFKMINYKNKEVNFDVLKMEKENEKIKNAKIFFKADIPSLGYSVYRVLKDKKINPEQNYVDEKIKTKHFEIKLKQNGGLEYLIDRNKNKILISSSFLSGRINDVYCESEGEFIKKLKRKNFYEITESGKIGGVPYEVNLNIYKDLPYFDVKIKINYNGEKIGRANGFDQKEKLHFKLNLPGEIKDVFVHKPFLVHKKNEENIDSSYFIYIPDKISVINKGGGGYVKYGNSIGYVLLHSIAKGKGCEYMPAQNGIYEYELRILVGRHNNLEILKNSFSFNYEPIIFKTQSEKGNLPPNFSFIKINGEILPASIFIYKDKIYLRIFNPSDLQKRFEILSNGNRKKSYEVDFNLKDEKIISNLLKKWEIRTIRLGKI